MLDLRTGKHEIVARSRGVPVGLSITKRNVYWAENLGLGAKKHGRVRVVTVPRRINA